MGFSNICVSMNCFCVFRKSLMLLLGYEFYAPWNAENEGSWVAMPDLSPLLTTSSVVLNLGYTHSLCLKWWAAKLLKTEIDEWIQGNQQCLPVWQRKNTGNKVKHRMPILKIPLLSDILISHFSILPLNEPQWNSSMCNMLTSILLGWFQSNFPRW